MEFRASRRVNSKITGAYNENIAGVRVVKAFARVDDTVAQFERANAANRRSGVRADIITAALGPMFTTMSILTIAATSLLGGWLALRGIVQVGVLATVERALRLNDDYQIMARGMARVRVDEWLTEEPYLKARISPAPEVLGDEAEIEALRRELLAAARRMIVYFPQIPDGILDILEQIDEPSMLVYDRIQHPARRGAGPRRARGRGPTRSDARAVGAYAAGARSARAWAKDPGRSARRDGKDPA